MFVRFVLILNPIEQFVNGEMFGKEACMSGNYLYDLAH